MTIGRKTSPSKDRRVRHAPDPFKRDWLFCGGYPNRLPKIAAFVSEVTCIRCKQKLFEFGTYYNKLCADEREARGEAIGEGQEA